MFDVEVPEHFFKLAVELVLLNWVAPGRVIKEIFGYVVKDHLLPKKVIDLTNRVL